MKTLLFTLATLIVAVSLLWLWLSFKELPEDKDE